MLKKQKVIKSLFTKKLCHKPHNQLMRLKLKNKFQVITP